MGMQDGGGRLLQSSRREMLVALPRLFQGTLGVQLREESVDSNMF